RRGQARRRGHVIPLAVMAQAIEAPGFGGAAPIGMDREGLARRTGRRVLEQARMQDLDTRPDEGRDLARIAEGHAAETIHGESAAAVKAGGAAGWMDKEKPVHPLILPPLGEPPERLAAAAAPDDLGIDDVEGRGAEQRQGLHDAAAAVENLGLMGE